MNTGTEQPHVAVCEMTFLQGSLADITEFHWKLGSYGGIIVPIRDFGVSNIEPDGLRLIYVRFERPLNHMAWLEVLQHAEDFGLEPTTREAVIESLRGGRS